MPGDRLGVGALCGESRRWPLGCGSEVGEGGGPPNPGAEHGLRAPGGGEVVGVHLVDEGFRWSVDEEGRMGGSGAAPEDVGW